MRLLTREPNCVDFQPTRRTYRELNRNRAVRIITINRERAARHDVLGPDDELLSRVPHVRCVKGHWTWHGGPGNDSRNTCAVELASGHHSGARDQPADEPGDDGLME